ncbi:MAG: hypothetical protein J6N19_02185 [Clostridium sp.]|nr:hypothetical protein [Clostridium sp.]
MAKKYVDNDGLLYFWQKIKNTFAKTSDVPTKTSDLTNDSGYITSADVPEGAAASTTTPKMDGTAAAGSETAFARGDHVHPVDTSRAPTSHASTGTTYGKGTSSNYGHVKLSDSTTETTAAASGGTAATPKAVSDALAAAKSYADGLDTGVSDVTVDGTSVVTGGIAAVDLSGKVPTSRTVNGKALNANITLTGDDIYYANGEVTIDTAISTLDNSKVDKVDGKGLSTNDYTTTEKNKLAGITSGAEVNQNAFSNVAVGSTTIAADGKTDTLTLEAGDNVTLTPDATNDKVTIAATDTVYTHPTYTSKSSGLYKITVDGTGHVSATASVTASDIPSLSAGKITSGTFAAARIPDLSGTYIATSQKGTASGVCPLNASSKIDSTYLPSYVDDVIEVEGKSGTNSGFFLSGTTTAITGETGKIYVLMQDFTTVANPTYFIDGNTTYYANSQFRWSGTKYVKLSDGGMSPITNAEIDTIVAS